MTRKVLSLVLVLALCSALLAGCANDAPAASQIPQEAVPENLAHRVETYIADNTWSGHTEYDNNQPTNQPEAAPAEPASAAPAVSPTACNICGEYDCDDGIYCDDHDEKQENHHNSTPCQVCGAYDCDDGIYCDDWDDKYDHHHHGHK